MYSFEELMERLNDERESSYSRRSALSELGRLRDERAVAPLVSALQDEDQYMRRDAAKALGELGSPKAIDPLVEALGDDDDYVRREAIASLGAMGDARAIEPLRKMLADQSYFTSREAERSIQKIEERLGQDARRKTQDSRSEAQDTRSVTESSPVPEVLTPVPEKPPTAKAPQSETTEKKLSDANREELREQVFDHHMGKAKELARHFDEEREADTGLESSYGGLWKALASIFGGEKKRPLWNRILVFGIPLAVFIFVFRGLIIALLYPVIVVGIVLLLAHRRARKSGWRLGDSVKTMAGPLRDPDPKVRANTARMIGTIGSKSLIGDLKEAMEVETDSAAKKAMEESIRKLQKR